jgi:ribulose bisphosphate carboxylase small subunit
MNYYLAPSFLDKLSVHITKNYLNLSGVKVPLILGIHGRKGEGKSFQCELVFERMGLGVVQMSAGELESPDAGDPARLIRLRYREAAESVKVNGRMAVLMINDIDAGMGRIDQFTQYTVNTQLVAGTLMNIADSPTNVQLPGSYDSEPIQRIPIIVTGNDFSTLYAPLIRDGRMEKFYWEPSRADRIGIVSGIFASDGVTSSDVETLVDTFPTQSIDFYSALHSRLYDEQVRQFIQEIGISRVSLRVVNSAEKLPDFRQPDASLKHLIELGDLMVREQQRIQELRLVQSYNNLQQSPTREPSPQPVSVPSPNGSHTNSGYTAASPTPSASAKANELAQTPLPQAALQTLREILDRGQRLGIEVVDARRFRTNSWQCYNMVNPNSSFEQAQTILATCFTDHEQDYIRLVGIDRDRRRIVETIVHRPE